MVKIASSNVSALFAVAIFVKMSKKFEVSEPSSAMPITVGINVQAHKTSAINIGRANRRASLQKEHGLPAITHSKIVNIMQKITAIYAVYQHTIIFITDSNIKGSQRFRETSCHTAHMISGNKISASSHIGLRKFVAVHMHHV